MYNIYIDSTLLILLHPFECSKGNTYSYIISHKIFLCISSIHIGIWAGPSCLPGHSIDCLVNSHHWNYFRIYTKDCLLDNTHSMLHHGGKMRTLTECKHRGGGGGGGGGLCWNIWWRILQNSHICWPWYDLPSSKASLSWIFLRTEDQV